MTRKRRRFTGEEKVALLKRHLIKKEKISDLCDEYDIQPVLFYRWQKEFFENGYKAFENPTANPIKKAESHISSLKQELEKRNSVISELVTSYIAEKKRNGAT